MFLTLVPGMRHSKIPVVRFTPDVLPNAINVGRQRGIKKPNIDSFKSTPRSSRNIEAYQPIAGRSFLPSPIKKKHTTTLFLSTQIIHCNFTTVQWSTKEVASTITIPAASAIPIPIRSRHFIFRGSDNDKSPVSTGKKLTSNHRQESRLEKHREMFKSRCAKNKNNDTLRGVRLNRRFDLQMLYIESGPSSIATVIASSNKVASN